MAEPLTYGKYYHIYNRGINSCTIFKNTKDYEYFLMLYSKYIESIADTYAWCLLGNHFHILVRIKEDSEVGMYKFLNRDFKDAQRNNKISKKLSFEDVKWQTQNEEDKETTSSNNRLIPEPINHFKHLFSSYAKYYNIKHNRHGSLFEKPFKRKEINHEKYFKQLIIYIHTNPVRHGFTDHPIDWGWSSYLGYFSNLKTFIKKNQTLEHFNDLKNFKKVHEQKTDFSNIENMLGVK
jgi:REP element-mobilizing transposase RayT